MTIEGIEISHPDKVLFPKNKITKVQVASYYAGIADKMLPYLKDRPLTLVRYPSGITSKGFYQKNANDYFPDFIKRVEVETDDGSNLQIICNNKKSLVYLANQNTISFHIWLSRKDKPRRPDKVVFDLDPPENSFDRVKEAAQYLREYLIKNGINPHLMTTGKSGLHVFYKIRRTKDFKEIKEQTRTMAEELASTYPKLFTTKLRKDQRENRIFLDYLRNEYAQTGVCPYSLRANENAGIATPIEWAQLETLRSADEFQLT